MLLNFIAHDIIERLELKPTPIDSVCIELLDRNRIITYQMLLDETVTLRGKDMTTDLIVFDMSDFDVIFSMNFLSWYGTEIDYQKKKIRFHLDDSEEFTFSKGRVEYDDH